MQENEYQIPANVKFPSQLDSFEEKLSKSFGLAVGSAISTEWFHRGGNGGTCRFRSNQLEFQKRENYANGNIDMRQYYTKLGTNGDTSLLNLATKSLIPVPKLVDLVVNGMCNRGSTIKANAIDPISQKNFQNYRQKIKDDMNSKEIIELAKEKFGVDIGSMPTDKLPETDDELNLHTQMEWKPSCELSAQMAVRTVYMENDYDLTIDSEVKRDLVVYGLGCIENRFHNGKGVVLNRINPKDVFYSKTKDKYFKNCFYKGVYEEILLSDLFIEFPNLRNQENAQIVSQLEGQSGWYNNYYGYGQVLKGHCHIIRFTYKTTKEEFNKIKEKSNGEKVVSKADPNFDESTLKKGQKNDFKRVSKVEEVLFEGVMALGTNFMLKWEVSKSMARPNSNKQKVCEQYNMVAPNFQEGQIFSLVSRMIPIADNLNVVELKAEQIIQKITPDGMAIDLDAIADIELGNGKSYDHNDALNMWLQTGSFLYRSQTQNGDFNNAQKPFTETKTGDSIGKLQALRQEQQASLLKLTDVIGLNQYSDASNPDKDSLVGIAKISALNSNLSTRHILDGAGYVNLKTAESTLYRSQDIIRYYPALKDDFIRKIGATAVEDLESIANLHLSDFALNLYLEIDDEEKAQLDKDLSDAMMQGLITIADKYKVKDIKIFDLAVSYLRIATDKASKKLQEQKAQEAQQKSDMDIRTSQQSNQFAQETIQLQMQADDVKQKAIGSWEIEKEKIRISGLLELEKLKGEQAMQLQILVNSGKAEMTEKLESAKKDNILEQGSIHSQITNQRSKDLDPIDFKKESAENAMFELE